MGSLYTYFQRISDTRNAKGKRLPAGSLLVLMMLAKLSGEDKPSGMADWVANRIDQFFEMKILAKKRAPSHMTYRRVLQNIVQPEEFERVLCEFQQSR